MKQYSQIHLEWKDRLTKTRLTLSYVSLSEALQRARDFGFKPGRWWQFWKPKEPEVTLIP